MTTLTFIHVALSLVGLASGFVILYALLESRWLEGWTRIFLATTIATSVTGFFFPFRELLPSHAFGILSLIALPIAIAARYRFHLAGPWGRTFAVSVVLAQYLNFFVLIVQLFVKTPALRALAPTQSEAPFVAAQTVALAAFAWLAVRLARKSMAQSLGPAGA
jgi:hypothetical protein